MALNMVDPGADSYTLTGAIAMAYKAGPTPTAQSVTADFTLCDYTGHSSPGLTWNGPLQESDGSWTNLSSMSLFEGSGTTTTNNVLGVLIVFGNDTTALAAAHQLDTPIGITQPGDGFGFVVELNAGPSGEDLGIVIS